MAPCHGDFSEDFSLLVTFLLVTFLWLFRGFFVALICLEKQCLGVFRGFFVALILGKFYAYSPWKNLPNFAMKLPRAGRRRQQNGILLGFQLLTAYLILEWPRLRFHDVNQILVLELPLAFHFTTCVSHFQAET